MARHVEPLNSSPAVGIETRFPLLKYRRTKIVATLGPSSAEAGVMEQMLRAGVNVFRLNFSHGTHEAHRALWENLQAAAAETARPCAVLADLCGPKIRVGLFPGGSLLLVAGETVTVTVREVEGGPGLIPSQYRELAGDVRPGDRILLDDGNLGLRVLQVEGTEILCRVENGGLLKNKKGMNLPGVAVSTPALTAKDREDARFALRMGVGILALSFVRQAAEVEELRALCREAGRADAVIIAKIEKPEALEAIQEILEAADGIMIARGDLGVELPPEQVPVAQEQLILEARRHHKPVIVATQMLESMITQPRPTRAEVSDVSTAVRAGADAVMLSAESASGQYPVEAVRMMDSIARQAEGHLWKEGAFGLFRRLEKPLPPLPVEDAVADAVAALTRDLRLRCVVVASRHGRSLAVIGGSRPAAPVVGVNFGRRAENLAHLLWGVIPVNGEELHLDNPAEVARRLARDLRLAEPGQHFLLVQGFHEASEKNEPTLTVLRG